MSHKKDVKVVTVVLGTNRLSIPEKVAKQQLIASVATQSSIHAHSKTIQSSLGDWSTTGSDLDQAHQDLQTLRAKIAEQEEVVRKREAAFDSAGSLYRNQVQIAAANDAQNVRSLGLEVKGDATAGGATFGPPAQLFPPKHAQPEGVLQLRWRRVDAARSYEVATAPDVSGPWTLATVVSSARVTLRGLPSKRTWVRVASVGSPGVSDWSVPVMVNVA